MDLPLVELHPLQTAPEKLEHGQRAIAWCPAVSLQGEQLNRLIRPRSWSPEARPRPLPPLKGELLDGDRGRPGAVLSGWYLAMEARPGRYRTSKFDSCTPDQSIQA